MVLNQVKGFSVETKHRMRYREPWCSMLLALATKSDFDPTLGLRFGSQNIANRQMFICSTSTYLSLSNYLIFKFWEKLKKLGEIGSRRKTYRQKQNSGWKTLPHHVLIGLEMVRRCFLLMHI